MSFGTRNAFALFLIAVIEEFHWSRGLVSGALMLGSIVWTLAAPFIGNFLDRFGARVVIPVGAIALFIGAGAGIGPWLGGLIHDLTGSYSEAFWVAQALALASVGFIWAAGSRQR